MRESVDFVLELADGRRRTFKSRRVALEHAEALEEIARPARLTKVTTITKTEKVKEWRTEG